MDFAGQPGHRPIREGLALLAKAKLLVGNNIIEFDIPAIKKVYPDWTYAGLVGTPLSCENDVATHQGPGLSPSAGNRQSTEKTARRPGTTKSFSRSHMRLRSVASWPISMTSMSPRMAVLEADSPSTCSAVLVARALRAALWDL